LERIGHVSRAIISNVTTIAPRLPLPLLEAIARLDDGRMPIAEVCRRVGREAERRGLSQPSYERVRVLVHVERSLRRRRHRPTTIQLMFEAGSGYRSGASAMDNIRMPRELRR
jgi:hypothetical protein